MPVELPTEKKLDLRAQLIDKQVTPARTEAWRGLAEAGLWGRLAIQFGFVLNGGALAILPALMAQTNGYSIERAAAGWSAWLFATGLIMAALCCFVAYAHFRVVTHAGYARAETENNYIDHVLYRTEHSLELAHRASKREAGMHQWHVWLGPVGLLLGLAVYIFFAWGALRLIPGLPWPKLW